MNQIKNRFTGIVICEGEESIKELVIRNRAGLYRADLRGADLRGADLRGAGLYRADLREADLREADLRGADLRGADLREADLREAGLREADLYRADLREADLRGADLRGAGLHEADLRGAGLYRARIEFNLFPSIRLLSSINLGTLSDKLTLELMRRDAYAHPHPERFDEWAKGNRCPYQEEERFWLFIERSEIWRKGSPRMTDRDLIVAICKEKGWEIKRSL